ncbi:hypothetical protein HMPREF0322_03940 [Desulfitobacterium hafniense DP7]|uniref:Uncharacterized protein n=1 Tax=Desulfitobacterium hafniense DP7 TaxID=537010 RepID=G9XSG8_DESHA|nr:hypothetical protein HMPREF0322_03940 [Desulfitobacterium hafniense DP7]
MWLSKLRHNKLNFDRGKISKIEKYSEYRIKLKDILVIQRHYGKFQVTF